MSDQEKYILKFSLRTNPNTPGDIIDGLWSSLSQFSDKVFGHDIPADNENEFMIDVFIIKDTDEIEVCKTMNGLAQQLNFEIVSGPEKIIRKNE